MAQNLAVCEFCDLSIKTTAWKCINCDLILCENCKTKRHSKIKGSEEHSVIMLKQMGTLEAKDSVRKLELANIICSSHKEEKCTAYCKSCSKKLCTFCAVEENHIGHQILNFETFYKEKVSELTSLNNKMKEDLPFFIKNMNKMEKICQEGNDNYNKAKQQIIQREKDIKEKATQDAEVLSRELDILLKPQNETFNQTKETLQKNVDYLEETTAIIDKMLLSNDVKQVLDTSFLIEKELPSKNIKALDVSLKSPVDLIAPVISIRFGSLVMPRLAILQSVQTPLQRLKCLESFHDGTYISILSPPSIRDTHTSLQYFEIKGSNYVEICKSDLEFKAFGMEITENNTILLLCIDEILSRFESNEMVTFFKYSTGRTRKKFTSICTLAKGTVLLGYSNKATYMPKYNGVVLLKDTGESTRSFQFNSNYWADKIAASKHGTYIISHQSYRKTVKRLSSTFQSTWTYTGHSSFISSIEFKPIDIAVSASGLIYVTDASTSSIHVLTSDGDFVANYGKEHGIIDPEVLHINKEGQLVIWCKDGTIHVADISS
ncbi:uncharacterized protein LOC134706206 [Mytilus trossulus]|uniref:uncharacterized protein LOC134706206 n=1 Tax=Mytilus trossulus TaxID=6551 RepID=UPI00300548C4